MWYAVTDVRQTIYSTLGGSHSAILGRSALLQVIMIGVHSRYGVWPCSGLPFPHLEPPAELSKNCQWALGRVRVIIW